MKDIVPARRYAQALYDVCKALHCDMEMKEELLSFSMALKRAPDLENFLKNPSYTVETKVTFLEKFYQKRKRETYGTLLHFLAMLLKKNRFDLVHRIAESYEKIVDTGWGMGKAVITTAMVLAPELEKVILKKLEAIAGHKITMNKAIDPSLIGGAVVRIHHQVIDGSIRNRMNLLKKELKKANSI